LFRAWVEETYPNKAKKIMARVQELHGGKDYDPTFGKRMTGKGKWAELMKQRFKLATKRLELDRRLPQLRSDLFRVPVEVGDQLSLL